MIDGIRVTPATTSNHRPAVRIESGYMDETARRANHLFFDASAIRLVQSIRLVQ